MAAENIVTIEKGNWEAEVLKADQPVLVDFWAEWCGPCKAIAPILDDLSNELGDQLKVVKVNVDDNQELAQQFEIRAIPTSLLFKGGEIVDTMRGAASKPKFKTWLEPHLG